MRLIAATGLALAMVLPTAAAAQDGGAPAAFSIETSGWRGGAYARPDTRAFSHCGIARGYDGSTLIFTRTPETGLNIGLDGVAPASEDGTAPDAALVTIDGRTERALPVIEAGPETTVLPVGEDAELIDRLRRGSTLEIRLGDRTLAYPLTGTFDSLAALAACVEAAAAMPGEQVAALIETGSTEPAPADDAPAAEPPPAAETETAAAPVPETIDRETLTRLLAAAGFENIAYARSEELPDNALDLDYAWQLDDRIVGGLHQQRRGPENAFDAFVEDYVARVQTVCPGESSADVGEIETFRERFGLGRATVTCQAGTTTAFIELFMALDDQHYSAFFHEASADDRDFAIEATESIEGVIRSMAGL
ncbi:MAG: hypothetical protein GVY28_07350 [Alphaproteobacteria bacterium]|jgi:hypothetical protein|nr:hypothetical protein [Alphaproteobacteria bacterium]